MNSFKRFAFTVLFGAFAGATVSSFVAPRMLAWAATPYGERNAMCNCADLASKLSSDILTGQVIGMALGAIAAMILSFVVTRATAAARRRSTPDAPPPV